MNAPSRSVPEPKQPADPASVPSLGSLLESSIPGWQKAAKVGPARQGFAQGARRWIPGARKPPTAAQPPAQPPPRVELPPQPMPPPPANMNERETAAYQEVYRILQLRKASFRKPVDWGFAVLHTEAMTIASVQTAYRKLMQKLHPDKVGHLPNIEKAVDVTREAKELCERMLSRQVPPGPLRSLRYTTICTTKGNRRFRLEWGAPLEKEGAPIQRYLVNAFDPAYGKALTITILEPDYSEELRRYISLEELTSFVLSEQELTKMPSLFQQRVANLQVAAANDAGTGPWASVQVPMGGNAASTARASTPAHRR